MVKGVLVGVLWVLRPLPVHMGCVSTVTALLAAFTSFNSLVTVLITSIANEDTVNLTATTTAVIAKAIAF